jgi:hypothetical protein
MAEYEALFDEVLKTSVRAGGPVDRRP